MKGSIDRREFLKLAGVGGIVFASGLGSGVRAAGYDDFYFVQLSDTHWGFEGPPNPDAKGTLRKAVAAVNALAEPPDFIMFTGDLTHTTDDPEGAAAAAGGIPRHRVGPQGEDGPLHAGRARRGARLRQGVQGILRRDALHVRPQGRAFHRARQRFRSGRADRRRAARLARRGPRAPAEGSQHRRLHAPAALRPLSAMGLGDARRRESGRPPDAVSRTSPCSTATSTRRITTRPGTSRITRRSR